MFCPQCGTSHTVELKFCKSCGTNLHAVRRVVLTGEADEKFNWKDTWLAEMMMSGEERVKRAAEIERLQGITPDTKRRNEIKAGVITASAGIGLLISLLIIMQGIVLSGRVTESAAEILARIWIVAVIPVLVGLALIINGVFVSKRTDGTSDIRQDAGPREIGDRVDPAYLSPPDTNPLAADVFSVTDETTRQLEGRPIGRRKSD